MKIATSCSADWAERLCSYILWWLSMTARSDGFIESTATPSQEVAEVAAFRRITPLMVVVLAGGMGGGA